MLGSKLFNTVRPYLSALAVIATAAILVFTIYFTQLDLQWTAFLTGILVAAILAEATRVTRAEWTVMRRTAQLSSLKEKLEHETLLREKAEARIAADRPRLHLLDEVLPVMVVLLDADGRLQYHNYAFREWLHLRPEQIDAHPLQEVVGGRIYEELKPGLQRSMQGEAVRAEHTLTMQDGSVYHLSFEFIPQYGDSGNIAGTCLLANDVTEHRDVLSPAVPSPAADEPSAHEQGSENQDMFIDTLFEEISGDADVEDRVVAAIENSAFHLLYQLIAPLAVDVAHPRHYEILIRLMEEEESMMPPGAFFPLAEKRGLMPYLDRWVVKHVLELATGQQRKRLLDEGSIFFINLARSTIRDPEFPAFVGKTLQEYGADGSRLCFEVPNSELIAAGDTAANFIQAVRAHGCRAALSGFGRDTVSFNLIRGFQVEFLKIDSSVILNLDRDPVDLAKVAAIGRVARKIGVQTIAEFVESDETVTKLKEVGIDFAQGFGISRPHTFDS